MTPASGKEFAPATRPLEARIPASPSESGVAVGDTGATTRLSPAMTSHFKSAVGARLDIFMRIKKIAVPFVAALPFVAPTNYVFAEDLLEIVITPNRYETKINSTEANVTVISEADIQRSTAPSTPELLKQLAGIDIANQGGRGKTSALYLRGASTSQTLVLLDGVRIGQATLGESELELLPIQLIDHIEIVKGARSALYGSDAIGGVIQIFTKKGKGQPSATLSASSGSNETHQADLTITGGNKTTSAGFVVNHEDTKGINVSQNGDPDRDGYKNNSSALTFSHTLGNDARVFANILQSNGRNEYDSTGYDHVYTDFTHLILSGGFKAFLTKQLEINLTAGESQNDNLQAYDESEYFSRRRNANVLLNYRFGAGNVTTIGAETLSDHVSGKIVDYYGTAGFVNFPIKERTQNGSYINQHFSVGNNAADIGFRHEDIENYGGHDVGSFSYAYTFSNNLSSYLTYGNAFRAPTFNDLYFPHYGNPDLKPETSNSLELGVKGGNKGLSWQSDIFKNRYKNLIVSVPIDADYDYEAENVAKADVTGFEFSGVWTKGEWSVNSNLTLLKPLNTSNKETVDLQRRARKTFNIGANYSHNKWQVGSELTTQSKRNDIFVYGDYFNPDIYGTIAGYGIVNAYAKYNLLKNWDVKLSGYNLADKDYSLAKGYNTLGREMLLSSQVSF